MIDFIRLALSVVGFLILMAFFIDRMKRIRAEERMRREQASRRLILNMGPRPWWKEPPEDDGPEGDY